MTRNGIGPCTLILWRIQDCTFMEHCKVHNGRPEWIKEALEELWRSFGGTLNGVTR